MKTAISIPDDTFNRVERSAAELGVSRSEFFTQAVLRYMEQLGEESTTRLINASLDLVGTDESTQLAIEAGRRRLRAEDEAW